MEKEEFGTNVMTPAAMESEKPTPLQERALTLYCEGWRASEIAVALHVSASRIRRWLKAALEALADEARVKHAEQLARAVEAQRAIASAAWDAYRAEREVERALLLGELDRVRRRTVRATRAPRGCAAGVGSEAKSSEEDEGTFVEEYERPRHTGLGARYLGVALAAQREVARLQGLYERMGTDMPAVHITLSRRPDDAANHLPPGTISEHADEPGGTDV
jgi:hypothetical protein